MATFDDTQFSALLDDPNEVLEVEYKSWLDMSSNEVRANLARHIAALANYGGGSIVFGITNAMQFAGPNPFPSPRCDRDLIASIVKKYLEPTFQCDVRDVVSSAGNTHPIVIVPPHGAVPICAKASGPMVNDRTMGIVQGVHYTRKPGPESAPIQNAAEWAPIIRRCAMHDRAAILGALDAALRGSGPASPGVSGALKQWHDAAHAAFLTDVGAQPTRANLAKWHWQVSYAIERSDGQILELNSLLETLRQVHHEVFDTVNSGWNMIDPQGVIDVRPSFQTDANSGLGDGEFVEFSALRSTVGVSIADLWRVSPDGKVTTVRDYWEDTVVPTGTPPGTSLSPNWMTRSLAEIVRHARAFTERFENPVSVSFRCEWYGLQGRILHSPSTLWSMRRALAPSDHRVATGVFPVTMLSNGLPEIVAKLIAPLMRAFTTDQLIGPDWVRGQSKTWLRG
jgi:Putative DNA-binding domain